MQGTHFFSILINNIYTHFFSILINNISHLIFTHFFSILINNIYTQIQTYMHNRTARNSENSIQKLKETILDHQYQASLAEDEEAMAYMD